jgi:transketolase
MNAVSNIAESSEVKASKLDSRSISLRKTVVNTLAASRRGHLGPAFSLIEILRVLYDDILRYNPQNPKWSARDRCLLSKGHGCLALYAILADKGFFPEAELAKFCHSDLSIGIGFALNARYENSDYRTFVILGDGESNEGSIWEAAMCAGKHKLSHLTVLIDYNKYQSYGATAEVQDLEPLTDKWKAFGFAVAEVDGHNVEALRSVLSDLPLQSNKPSAIICHTIKGKGVKFAENNMSWHHKGKVTDAEIQSLLAALEAN